MIRSEHENRKPFAPICQNPDSLASLQQGHNTRSKVEAAISRYKRVIGDTLKSRHDTRRATDVAIAIKSLNRMNQLGRAIFTRIA